MDPDESQVILPGKCRAAEALGLDKGWTPRVAGAWHLPFGGSRSTCAVELQREGPSPISAESDFPGTLVPWVSSSDVLRSHGRLIGQESPDSFFLHQKLKCHSSFSEQ